MHRRGLRRTSTWILLAIGLGIGNVATAKLFDIARLEAIAGEGYFRPYSGNPLLVRGASGNWDDWALGSASVIEANGLYHMYFEGWGQSSIQIGHATSPDGVNWTKDSANPTLPTSAAGWDSGGTWDPFVIYEDGKFKMWYGGSPKVGGQFQWGYAESTDGSNFAKVGKISNIPNGGEVEDDHVVRDQATGDYHMYYWNRNYEPYGLFRASSSNETDFNFNNPVPVTIDGVNYPTMYKFTHVIQENGLWGMFYGEFVRPRCDNCRIGYATSTDGVSWTTQNSNVLVGQDGEVLKIADDLYIMYYGPDGFFDGEHGDVRMAVMKGSLSHLAAYAPEDAPPPSGNRVWDAGAGDGLWNSAGNWQENNANGPGGVVPSAGNVYFDFGHARVNSIVPAVKDVFLANNVAPPQNASQPSNHTVLDVEQGGWLRISDGQLKIGAFTGPQSPSSGVKATLNITGNGTIDSKFGIVTNPFYHPITGNISSVINISDYGQLNAGTGISLGGGATVINLSDEAALLAPDGLFEILSNGSSKIFNPNNISSPYGIDLRINLSQDARFVVSNTGPFATTLAKANALVAAGVIQAKFGVVHFVQGLDRVFMAAPLPGDFNDDGIVDVADYTVWRNHMGNANEDAINGAGDGLGGVDHADYVIWKSYFGQSWDSAIGAGAHSPSTVPEPTIACMIVIIFAAGGGVLRHHRSLNPPLS